MWSIWFFIYDLKSHLRSVKPHPQMSSDSAVPESDISIIWAVTFKHALRYVPSIRWVPDRQVLLSANHLRWCQTGRASDRLPAPGSGVPACRAGPGGAEGRPGPPAAARAGPQEGDRLHGAQDTLPVTYEVKMNNLVHKLSELLHKNYKLKFFLEDTFNVKKIKQTQKSSLLQWNRPYTCHSVSTIIKIFTIINTFLHITFAVPRTLKNIFQERLCQFVFPWASLVKVSV